tara:strand:+ start:851 stop:1360 length:510 start_codon:yes stop_codon:yes gene_type:complete
MTEEPGKRAMNRNLISCALTLLFLSAGCSQQDTAGSKNDPERPQIAMNDADGMLAPKPAVMLGVNMIPSGPIMAKHIGVDGDKSTMIIAVGDETPASQAGLELWDVIVSVNGSRDASPSDLRMILRASKPGDVIDLEILRGVNNVTLEVVLVEADHDRMMSLPAGTDGT